MGTKTDCIIRGRAHANLNWTCEGMAVLAILHQQAVNTQETTE